MWGQVRRARRDTSDGFVAFSQLTTIMRRKADLADDEAFSMLATGIAGGGGGHGLAGGSESGARGEQHERGRSRMMVALCCVCQ